jgi:ATP-dependent helicase/nuclease subunit A
LPQGFLVMNSAAAAYEHNGQPVSRVAFYAIACDPRRSVAVEACAGAGKTWMLVSRILRALLEGMDEHGQLRLKPHEILAITFTKKAAGEMRQRLREWLQDFARKTPEALVPELLARGLSPAAALAASGSLQGLYRLVLGAGRPVQIRTFHSWFAALLRTAPLSVLQALGLPANYELLEDDAEAVAEVWRGYLAAVAADPVLRADYQAVVDVHGRSQTQKALASALAKRVEFGLADEQGVVDASVLAFGEQFPDLAGLTQPEDWLTARPQARALLLGAALVLGRASAPTFSAKGVALEQAVTASHWPGVLDALLTQKGEPRKFGDKIAGIERVREAQDAVQAVERANRQHLAWLYQQRMARLTRRLIAEFAALKRERGWVDMNDVERAARVMLSDPVLSGWVQERLDARVKHLLIDEFQDTNPLQWQALHAWLSGYAGAGGGASGGAGATAPSVFIVGDPKQSIYRFRRAEPQVFRAAQAFVARGLGGDLLSCDHTRRNATGVIATVNRVMQAAQDQGEYAGFRAHTTESGEAGAVLELPPIPRPDKAQGEATTDPLAWRDSLSTPREQPEETLRSLECRQAAQWVAGQLAAGLAASTVMVLARKRDRLAVMQDELRQLGIPTEQPEKADLAEAPEVQDVVALLDALVSPAHDLSLARALRSPLFGVEDADLVPLALLRREPAHRKASWLDLLQQAPGLPAALQGLGARLAQYQAWLQALPPHDALHAIYEQGDVLARFAAAAPAPQRERVLANLRALLAAALQIEGARYLTPYALVRAFRKGRIKAPNRANAEAVRLLTVHGAKGLEAQAVLLLDTDAQPSRAETMGVLVDWPGEAACPRKFVFLASESAPPPCAQDTLAAEQAERQREELNALYVAMTRAKAQLVVSSVEAKNATPGSWWRRIAPLAVPVEPVAAAVPGATTGASAGDSFHLSVLPAVPPAPVTSAALQAVPEPETDSLAARLGQAMHGLLEHAADASGGWSPARLAQLAQAFEIAPAQVRQAADMARCILAGEGAWVWDAHHIEWAGNEVELVHQGQRLRLDRLVRRRGGGWWVLDYKSAVQPEAQAALVGQLQRYRRAVQAACPGEAVSAAFLTAEGRLVKISGDA